MELIGAGLGDNVDVAADKTAVGDIIGCDIDIKRFDSINGNRGALGCRGIFG